MGLYIFMTNLHDCCMSCIEYSALRNSCGGKENMDFMEVASRGKKQRKTKALVKLLFMNTDSKIQSLNSKK